MSIKVADLKKKAFGQVLIERGLLEEDELKTGLSLQRETNQKLGRVLVDLGYISEKDLLAALSDQLNVPFLSMADYPKMPIVENVFPLRFMKQCKFVPINLDNNLLSIAMADPLDFSTIDSIKLFAGYDVKVYLGMENEVADVIEKFYGSASTTLGRIIEGIGDENIDSLLSETEDIERLKDLASEAPVIRLVNMLISRAIESRASDIHIEPFEKELKVRYRIDGILHDVESPPKKLTAAIISRVKIMAKLNIAERRVPQDGRIPLKVLGKEIDLRISTLPTMHGESVVMRILDKSSSNTYDIANLGFPADSRQQFENLIARPHGILLVTGPTGSGKTTTLYSALGKINLPDKKIITIEDPVEYQMDGVNQIHVNPQIGLTFAAGLRHIVRQDPDVIMIGEIRDLETAEIAIRSALTGHLVFSTLHTNDAPGAITRLTDMGANDYLIASSLLGVMAQRLVRVICPHCKVAVQPVPEFLRQIGFPYNGDVKFYEGAGCEKCSQTGYIGRLGIFELMPMNEGIRRLTLSKADATTIKKEAVRAGMRTLRDDGWLKVKDGITTISEILRVSQEEL
ncbi:MAG: type II secretion system ATPase GspE [Acidobacteria bacterium]|nr:type II secretion system ATPase GspE [Acidobacteriota bacterium]MBI3658150.1 type II secretion system ATPase GspE [Acidobacteriota bacterium]